MLKVHVFARFPGTAVVNGGPACLKLETWLRIAGIAYETVPAPGATPPPKGKFPFIEDDGVLMGDSTLILDHLKRTRHVDPDKDLSSADRAIGVAFRRLLKEHFYWVMMQTRYADEWPAWRKIVRPGILAMVGGNDQAADVAVDGIRKNVLEQLMGHGMGRHTPAEIHALGIQDLTSVSDYLDKKPFFFGETPTGVDATVYAHVANLLEVPLDSPSTRFGRERKNLVDYCARMRERFFRDVPQS